MKKKVLLGAKYSVIEPLGLLHLSSIAKEEGWRPKIVLIKDNNFKDFDKTLNEFNPKYVGFTVYTGNHLPVFYYCDKLKERNKDIKIIFGGPHATYFPRESIQHSDYVVLSEGFNGFREILKDNLQQGIIPLTKQEDFPISDREEFYRNYPEYKNNPIKSIITQTGCPHQCTYCYNSSTLENIVSALTPIQYNKMEKALAPSRRLFPIKTRSVEDVVNEISTIKKTCPKTKMIYFQDDIFIKTGSKWIKEFSKKFSPLGLSFHAQVRFEYVNPKNQKSKEKLQMMREAGCTGLTIAIESADPIVRKEVLNRNMNEDLMFNSFEYLNQLGYKVRTEQMLGLPLGATSTPTKINLEADLETLKLNVKLKEQTGLPTMAWASIFAPYGGTKIGEYCKKHGFYLKGNEDVPKTFFRKSVLNFPKKWVGPILFPNKKVWFSHEEQEDYKDKLQLLRDLFNYFALIPKGDKLAKRFLEQDDKSFFGLSTETRRHLYDSVLYGVE